MCFHFGPTTERHETTSTLQSGFENETEIPEVNIMQLPTNDIIETTIEATTFEEKVETVNASMKNTLGPIDRSKFDPMIQRCGFIEFVLFLSIMVNMLLTCLALILTIVGKRKVYKYILREKEDMKEM